MFRNYFKTAVRNLLRNKFYSLINILGLAVGLATCLLIFLYVTDELSYDKYHEKANRIYRVDNELKFGGNYFDLAVAPALQGISMARELPQIEQYTRLRWRGDFLVKKGDENVNEPLVAYADSTFFDVFTMTVIDGDSKTALVAPRSLVITEKMALKYFNKREVAGNTLLIDDSVPYKVTAVIKESPEQSHFRFDFFVPMVEDPDSRNENWLSENWNTYVVVKENTDMRALLQQTNALMAKYTGPQLKSALNQDMEEFTRAGGMVRSGFTLVTDIHLHSNKVAELFANGSSLFVYIFSAIAMLILLIACVNFMNLSTARSANRAKEVGVRKVLGSLKKNLVQQFLAESLLLSLIALVFALVIAAALLSYFNQLSGKNIQITALTEPSMLIALVCLVFIVGLLAGSYPAFVLSAFQPVHVLKGKLAGGFRRSNLQSGLVVFQFVISIALIFGTIVIYNQLRYIRNKDLGFDRSQVIVLQQTQALGNSIVSFRNELMKMPGIENASISGYLPVNFNRSNDAFFTSPVLDQTSAVSLQKWRVDENYIPTLDMKIVQGRNFSPDFPGDSNGLIINEAAAQFLNTDQLLNKKLYTIEDITTKEIREFHIVGVVKNFNFSSLRSVVTPLGLTFAKSNGNISIRAKGGAIPELINQIKEKWTASVRGAPFSYTFMDEDFEHLYSTEERTGRIFITFAAIAIIIACLGLFGLITYAAQQRIREIGIRKVLGASVSNITAMLSISFLKLVLIASLIAFPLAWWMMNKWLEDFAYRANIAWWVFVAAGAAAMFIAILTVAFQALRAALGNPVDSLRTE